MSSIADADALKADLDKHRPLDAEKMAVIAEKLNIEWTYHSNAIEGNTLTLQETRFFLREGLTVEGKPLDDFLAAKNHYEAVHFLEGCLDREITEALIKEIHALLLRGIDYIQIGSGPSAVQKRVHPGQYKYDNNHVARADGTIRMYCDYLQVPGEMEKLVQWLADNKARVHPVELAAGFHHRLVAIHPFTDGNGRVSRLLMNLILMQHRYPPAVIRNEDRRQYLDALAAADSGDLTPFTELVAAAVARTLRLMLDVAEGRVGLTADDVKAKIDRLSRGDRSPDLSEIIETARKAGQTVKERIATTVSALQQPAESGRRFEIKTTWSMGIELQSDAFSAFCRRQGLSPLGYSVHPNPHVGLSLSFIDVALPDWMIRFLVALTSKEVVIFRASDENDGYHTDLFTLPVLITPILSPDLDAVTEFVLREVAAWVERASAALEAHEQDMTT